MNPGFGAQAESELKSRKKKCNFFIIFYAMFLADAVARMATFRLSDPVSRQAVR